MQKIEPTIGVSPDFQTFTLKFPEESLPSDNEIIENSYRGYMDTANDFTEFGNKWIDGDMENLGNFIKEKYPNSDNLLVVQTPESTKSREEQISKITNRVIQNSNPRCDCGDELCPHKLSMLEIMTEMARINSDKEVDFTKFRPFEYPLVSVLDYLLPYISYFMRDNPEFKNNMFRTITRYSVDLEVLQEIPLNRHKWEMVEAIFFPDKLPDTLTILSNGGDKYTCKPNRKYNFLGLYPKSKFSDTTFKVTTEAKTIDFCVIGWHFINKELVRMMDKIETYISDYKTSDGKSIRMLQRGGITIWNNM